MRAERGCVFHARTMDALSSFGVPSPERRGMAEGQAGGVEDVVVDGLVEVIEEVEVERVCVFLL